MEIIKNVDGRYEIRKTTELYGKTQVHYWSKKNNFLWDEDYRRNSTKFLTLRGAKKAYLRIIGKDKVVFP